jgi:hypothetical protein
MLVLLVVTSAATSGIQLRLSVVAAAAGIEQYYSYC